MKKLKALSLCAVMLLLCGCSMKMEYKMEIKKDKSMEFSIISAMDDEMIQGMMSMEDMDSTTEETAEYTDEEIWEFLEETNSEEDPSQYGFKTKRYEEGKYKGFVYTKTIKNIDDITGDKTNFELSSFENIDESVVFVKDGENYKASFVMDNEEMSEETEDYGVELNTKFVVTLPNKPVSHNATSVSEDGKTLTWDLKDVQSKNIEFEFNFKNNTMLYVGIIAGATLLVIIIAVVAVMVIKKNKKSRPAYQSNVESMTQPQITPTQPIDIEPQTPVAEQPQNEQNNNQ